jgi:hypothetical protein
VKAQKEEETRYVSIPDFYRFDNIPEVLERNRTRIQNDIRRIANQLPEPEINQAGSPQSKKSLSKNQNNKATNYD